MWNNIFFYQPTNQPSMHLSIYLKNNSSKLYIATSTKNFYENTTILMIINDMYVSVCLSVTFDL